MRRKVLSKKLFLTILMIYVTCFSEPVLTQTSKPVLALQITVGTSPTVQLTAREDEMVTAQFKDVEGTFGFVANLDKARTSLNVTILDVTSSPNRKLGEVIVPVKGKAVQTNTSPSFKIVNVRLSEPK